MIIPANMLPHTVTATPYLGESAYGARYGEPVEWKARVEFTSGMTQDKEGRDTTYAARLFLGPEAQLTPDTALSFTDEQDTEHSLTVISVEPMYGIYGGISHIEATAKLG